MGGHAAVAQVRQYAGLCLPSLAQPKAFGQDHEGHIVVESGSEVFLSKVGPQQFACCGHGSDAASNLEIQPCTTQIWEGDECLGIHQYVLAERVPSWVGTLEPFL
jgi:hypothetical protein